MFIYKKSGGKKTILDKEEEKEEEERKIRIFTTFPIAIFSVTNKRNRGQITNFCLLFLRLLAQNIQHLQTLDFCFL